MKLVHLKTSSIPLTMLVIYLLILLVGAANLYSASILADGSLAPYFKQQMIWYLLGFMVMIIFFFLDYRIWQQLAPWLYVVSILLLILVIFFGKNIGGQKNWLVLGAFRLQPAEFAKLTLILMLANFFQNRELKNYYRFQDLKTGFLLALIPLLCILAVHDVGNALFFILITMCYFLLAGVQRKLILLVVSLAILTGGMSYQFLLKDYQKKRIMTFLNPEADTKGSGYHLFQSKIAVGSGGFLGKGYQQGTVHKLKYLPERHTDFIFPVWAEEWGFLGSVFLLLLYFILIMKMLSLVFAARDPFAAWLCIGVVSFFFWHIVINLGGVLGLMPLTGVPLPFLSYGGSSVMAMSMGLGWIFSIYRRRNYF